MRHEHYDNRIQTREIRFLTAVLGLFRTNWMWYDNIKTVSEFIERQDAKDAPNQLTGDRPKRGYINTACKVQGIKKTKKEKGETEDTKQPQKYMDLHTNTQGTDATVFHGLVS